MNAGAELVDRSRVCERHFRDAGDWAFLLRFWGYTKGRREWEFVVLDRDDLGRKRWGRLLVARGVG